jgi:hypothetical protein
VRIQLFYLFSGLLWLASCQPNLSIQRGPASTASKSCAGLLEELVTEVYYHDEAAKDLKEILAQLKAIDAEVLAGSKNPSWKDVDALEKLSKDVYHIKYQKYEFPEDANIERFYARVLAELQVGDEQWKALIKTVDEYDVPKEFAPTEYEMRSIIRRYLNVLQEPLPNSLRIGKKKLKNPHRNEKLILDGIAITKGINPKFDDLIKTTGFDTYDDFLKAVAKQKEELGDIVDLMLKEEVSISMNRPENARWWVPKVGFQNQFVTGSSKGALDPNSRNAYEASRTWIDPKVYKELDNDLKPKYGYVAPKLDSPIQNGNANYGGDRYIFDLEKVRKRMTWTHGDSRARFGSSKGYQFTPEGWDETFIPWDRRGLAIPFLSPNTKNNSFRLASGSQSKLPGFKINHNSSGGDYMELQFWGPLTLDDVSTFVFKGQNAPEGEFLEALLERKIKIFQDASNGKEYLPWTPTKEVRGPASVEEVGALDQKRAAQIAAALPGADASKIRLTNGVGRVDTSAEFKQSYFVMTENPADPNSKFTVIPMATSRYDKYNYNTDEWWDKSQAAEARGEKIPREDTAVVERFLRQHNLSTNPDVLEFSGVDGPAKKIPAQLLP